VTHPVSSTLRGSPFPPLKQVQWRVYDGVDLVASHTPPPFREEKMNTITGKHLHNQRRYQKTSTIQSNLFGCHHLEYVSSATSFPKYHKCLRQITIFLTSCKPPPLTSDHDRDHFQILKFEIFFFFNLP